MSEKRTFEERFFKRVARHVSEFHILTILAEKGECHPYEIQQILKTQIFQERQEQANKLEQLIQVGQKILDYRAKPSTAKYDEIESIIAKLPITAARTFFSKGLIDGTEEKDVNLTFWVQHGQELFKHEKSFSTLLNSTSAVYHVMKDLEDYGYIRVKSEETHKGRSRKLYEITEKGRAQAPGMLLAFGEMTQTVTHGFHVFQQSLHSFFEPSHVFIQNMMNILLPDSFELSELDQSEFSNLIDFLEFIFPIVRNESLFLSMITQGHLNFDELPELPFKPFHVHIVQQYLLDRLRNLQKKVEHGITILESMDKHPSHS
ncbi:MAG: PadR family transcriptional regulator [Candidatus Heimdallarchaeota archaeon]